MIHREQEALDAPAAQAAFEQLLEGHRRFHNGEQRPRGMVGGSEWRAAVAKQEPLAVVVTCADARISPDTLFDQLPGKLFEVRVAGPVASAEVVASVEFAVEKLAVPLIMVMSHGRCGAVQAAWARARALREGGTLALPPHLSHLVDQVVIAASDLEGKDENALHDSEGENARAVARELLTRSELLSLAVERKGLAVVATHFDLDSGLVERLPPAL